MKHTTRTALRICTLCLAAVFLFQLTGCRKKTEPTAGTVYFLNFKPEIADVYDEIAQVYQKETGVTLRVVSAASNTYEQTLKSEIAKSDAPTLFQINGPIGYAAWKDYCADLSDTAIYQHLIDKDLAITSGGKVYGIPYVIEGYGIIVNNAIMEKYFALPDRATEVKSLEEIKNFDTLKAVVEDMTAHKEVLGIDGVFASTSLKSGEDWRWQTHLANIPMYYEFMDKEYDLTTDTVSEVEFAYSDNYRNLFDLYLNNSATDPKLAGSKQVTDSMAEFATGKCAMVQNGTWAWSQIKDVSGNVVKEEDIRMLPMYTGMEGEEAQGLSIGTENYLAINAKASAEDQKLAAEFVNWLFTSATGKKYVTEKLEFITPFDTFSEEEQPDDPLAKELLSWQGKENIRSIPWVFTVFPSQNFKTDFGSDLLQYAQGNKEWDEVVGNVTKNWMTEAKG